MSHVSDEKTCMQCGKLSETDLCGDCERELDAAETPAAPPMPGRPGRPDKADKRRVVAADTRPGTVADDSRTGAPALAAEADILAHFALDLRRAGVAGET